MAVAETIDVRHLLHESESFGPEEIELLRELISGPGAGDVRKELRALKADLESGEDASRVMLTRAGVCAYLLGEHDTADAFLSRLSRDGLAAFYHGLALTVLERHAEAEKKFQQAEKRGDDPVAASLQRVGAIRRQGRLEEAESLLRSLGKNAAGRADYSFQMGCILADRGDTFGAVEYFERAVDMDPHHSQAMFRLAAENALRGDDDEAVRLYEQSLSKPPYYLGALLNLGLLYEDRENYAAAAYCFRRILQCRPDHDQARLYLKDIEAAGDMYYDEESARRQAQLTQVYKRSVGDFELSARCRNCLENLGIHTVGDLTTVTEQDLLSSKNFGETSLQEIRELMEGLGLVIGQDLHRESAPPVFADEHVPPEEHALLSQPVTELNLSARARKCMGRLGISTVGELVQRTPDELLSSKNFGVTSLNEVRGKLAEHNLRLRND